MRIAIVVNSFPILSETFIFNKVIGLRKAGINVTVYALSKFNNLSFFTDRIKKQDLNFIIYNTNDFHGFMKLILLSLRHPKIVLALWSNSRKLYGCSQRAIKACLRALPLRIGLYDIIHFVYSGIAVSYIDAIPLLSPTKIITSCRGTAEQITPIFDEQRGKKLRMLFPMLSRVHCVSIDMQSTMEKYGMLPENSFVNYPSIDTTQFKRSTPYCLRKVGPYKLLTVGRLHWKKGLEIGLLSVKNLISGGYSVTYDIVGGGPEQEKILFMIHDLGLENFVRLLGPQSSSKVRETMEKADIFLLPSISEGLSNAALEAMAMELPIVSTTAGGMSEAIKNGIDGFLVDPYDPIAMAEKTRILLKDLELRLQIGQSARKKIENKFSIETQIDKFILEYQSLISN